MSLKIWEISQSFRPEGLYLYFKKTPTHVFCCEIFENFKSTYFEEHLGTTTSECLIKISPLLVLGTAVLDGQRRNWTINAFY